MSTKTMSSTTDENRELRKQIGCMNSIFQIFDRHHFLTGRRLRGHHHKRLLQGATDPQHTTKAITEKAPIEAQKEKPRISTESSLASYSSSSCSSTFSSLDFNRIAQPETLPHRQNNILHSPFPLTPSKAPQSPIVKDSMYREARGLSIKPQSKEERQGTVMKHIDSPRPSFQQPKPKSPKPILPKVLGGAQEGVRNSSKYERLALPRLSYDGRESRDAHKWAGKHKELPRFSLDSKPSSMKSRLDFSMENENPSHNKTSSIVTKLMGLENFPATICGNENSSHLTFKSPNQATYSPRVLQENATSPSPRFHDATFVRKSNSCSRFPIEPAPWRQQDSSRGSPKMATQGRKAATNNRNLSLSVFGEIEKRITELQFQKSGKDLRALKQILEAMQKTREQLEDRTKDSNFSSTWKNSSCSHQFPTMEGPCTPKPLASSIISKPSKVVNKVRISASNQQGLQNPTDVPSKHNSLKDFRQHLDRNTTEAQHKVGNCTRQERSFGVVSPRLQQGLLRTGQSRPTTPSSNLGRAEKHCGRKAVEKGLKERNQKVRAKDLQLSDDKLSEISNETGYSCHQDDTASEISESVNSQVSQKVTEVASRVHSVKINSIYKENSVSRKREHMPAVEINVIMSEQPSPISVLDSTFYCEDSPSPVKKVSTAFQDESPSPDEAEWHLKNLNHSTDFPRSNHAQKFENFQNPIREPTFLTKSDKIALDHKTSNHRYINKILLTSGLLKDSSFTSTTDQLLSSCHLINPDMFHVLEQTEGLNGEVCGNNDRMQLQNKTQRKLIFDMVDEILVRKMTSDRLRTSVAKKTSPQGLLKEVYLEMDRVCSIPKECVFDDKKEQLIRLLTADMACKHDWTDYSGEVPALVLDIERMIFKDLINEVITVDYDWPLRHCRNRFKLKTLKEMEQNNGEPQQQEQPPALLNCPRCNSPDTKFRYYNNKSLTQPRYSCRTCRRQWTAGGILRNIPIGGNSKSGKQTKASSSRNGNPPTTAAEMIPQNHPTPVYPQGSCYFNDDVPCLDVIQSLIHPIMINQHENTSQQAFHQQIPRYIESPQTYNPSNDGPPSHLHNNSFVQPTRPIHASSRNNYRGDVTEEEMDAISVNVDEWLNLSDDS